MFLQKIEIENFKSFKSFTSIDLSPDKTIIVGKNGSGKSNIINAISTVICCKKLSKEDRTDLIYDNKIGETALITLYIDNYDQRLNLQHNVKITRIIKLEKDEYFLNDKIILRKDLQGILENGGISLLPYFIIKQGKISELINMTDKQRFDLIKNISGAQKYENERENCIKMLNEGEITKKKVTNNLKIINDKLKSLEIEKNKFEIYKKLENDKRRYEIAYLQKELMVVNNKLEEIENDEDVLEDCEDIDFELKKINNKITELENSKMELDFYLKQFNLENQNFNSENKNKIKNDYYNENENFNSENYNENYKIKNDNENYKQILEDNKLKDKEIETEIIKSEELLKKYKNEEKDVFIQKMYLKNLINYLSEGTSVNKVDEIKNALELIEEKKKFITENKTTGDVLKFETINKMIEKRKELWREEKKCLLIDKNLFDNIQSHESKLVTSGNYSYKIYKDIKDHNGVIGCIFDLFDVPDELISAFEAVAGGFLFNVVVSEDVFIPDLIKKVNGSVTFIPLNKMIDEKVDKDIKENDIFKLSSKIKYKHLENDLSLLLDFITKSFYVVKDLERGSVLSTKYNINVVTLDGDMIRRSGTITGGYDNKSSIIKEFKKILKMKKENLTKLENIKHKISKLNFEIDTIEKIQKQNDGSFNEIDLIVSIVYFLEEKIKILNGKGHKKQYYENKLENVSFKSLGIKNEIIKLENELDDLHKNKEEIDTCIVKISNYLDVLNKYKDIGKLKEQEKSLKNKKSKSGIIKETLFVKQQNLINKIGINTEILYSELTDKDIADKLKIINEELQKYIFINKRNLEQWNTFIDQKNDLLNRQTELLENYETIVKFINNLDEKKEEKMNLTFENIKTNFEFFSKKLCNFDVCLSSDNSELKIILLEKDGTVAKNLSGGQKTMVSIAIIFSIQKVDPSPFYIFDEVDANLDEEGRIRLKNLFSYLNECQFIVTTFKSELLSVGSKFIGVSYSEKTSYASEVEMETASNFLNE